MESFNQIEWVEWLLLLTPLNQVGIFLSYSNYLFLKKLDFKKKHLAHFYNIGMHITYQYKFITKGIHSDYQYDFGSV